MKILSDKLATSALVAIALLSLGIIAGILPSLFGESGLAAARLPEGIVAVLFFPLWLLMRLCPEAEYWPEAMSLLLDLVGLALTLALWTGLICGLRRLLASHFTRR